jgi:predicted nucleic acid-binding protein
MSKVNLFLDSSALFSGIVSPKGAARVLLLLTESDQIIITISEQVVTETERAIARKIPGALSDFRQAILASHPQIVRDPDPAEVKASINLVSHPADVSIILSAMKANVDFLVTHNRIHFLDDTKVAERTKLRIGTPGDALSWVREQITKLD